MIELLVVIAIISLLVSILLPSLNRAKSLARRVVCVSNLSQFRLAIQMYANDHDGNLGFFGQYGDTNLATLFDEPNGWQCALWPVYVPDKGLFRCPADETWFPLFGCSYAYTHYDTGPDIDMNLLDRQYSRRGLLLDWTDDNHNGQGRNVMLGSMDIRWFEPGELEDYADTSYPFVP